MALSTQLFFLCLISTAGFSFGMLSEYFEANFVEEEKTVGKAGLRLGGISQMECSTQ